MAIFAYTPMAASKRLPSPGFRDNEGATKAFGAAGAVGLKSRRRGWTSMHIFPLPDGAKHGFHQN
jgi:hypothetical protein